MAMFVRIRSQVQQQSSVNFFNSSIKQLVQTGFFTEALKLYSNVFSNNGFKPDSYTFPYILKASSQLKDTHFGFMIHTQTIKFGFDSNLFVSNSLILFYGGLGRLQSVRHLFDISPQRNIVTWTAVISAFTQNERFDLAIEFFRKMQISGIKPNSFTMATLLSGFSGNHGSTEIHGFSIKHGFETDVYVATALIDVYSKCGSVFSARQVFNEMPVRNSVSWNSICLAYNQNGYARETLNLFTEMQNSSILVKPDSFSIVTALCACSDLASLNQGREIHGYIYRANLESSVIIGTVLVDMYGKCGVPVLAERVFHRMQEKDVGTWTALISCYGFHGEGQKAIAIFESMKSTNAIKPNSVTFTAILTACSHSYLVEDGLKCFKSMVDDFRIEPTMKHYVCMVDLLGRAGKLIEALKFIEEMPIRPDYRVWGTLLGSATIHGDAVVTVVAANKLRELESEDPEHHVQLAIAYANSGKWEDVERTRCKVQSMKHRKIPGSSSVQVVV